MPPANDVTTSQSAPRFAYVLWDCDGTLLDTLSDLAAAANHICTLHGWPTFTEDEYRFKVGNGQRMLVKRFMPAELLADEDLVEDVTHEFSAYYAEHKEDRTAPYPGILAMLSTLKDAGIHMGILTNKNQPEAEALIRQAFGDLIEAVQGCSDDMPPKPEPPMTHALMERLGGDPSTTLMVGDTSVDIACGRNVGLATCGVLWGFRDRAELEEAGADYIAATPDDVVAYIEQEKDIEQASIQELFASRSSYSAPLGGQELTDAALETFDAHEMTIREFLDADQ